MQLLLLLGLFSSLIILAYQDFKDREISWWTLPLIIILYEFYNQEIKIEQLIHFGYNIIFILLNGLIVSIYFSIKEKRWVNIINSHLGLGDILFFVVCALMFNLPNFIIFMFFSFVSAILFYLIFYFIRKKAELQIPLAGVMATLLIPILILDFLSQSSIMRNMEWLNNVSAI